MKPLMIALVLTNSFLFSSLSLAEEALDPNDPAVQGSYAIGVNTGMQLRELLSALEDTDLIMYDEAIIRGLVDGFKDSNAMNDELFDSSMEWFNENANAAMEKKQAAIESMNEEEALANLKASLDFLDQNETKKGVVTLPSGLQYKVLKAGSGISPTMDDRVRMDYAGSLMDGTEFDSTYERQVSTTLSLDTMMEGWQEAFTLMKKGAKWKVFIPPHLAYGENKYDGIPSNSALIFDLELLDVIKSN